MRRLILLLAAAFGTCSVLLLSSASLAQDEATLERRVKAAFIYKFASYVEWPENTFASPTSPIVIGVLGDDAMLAELAQVVAGRAIDSHPITVRRIRPAEPVTGLHVLFIGHGERARATERAPAGAPLLVITEHEHALDHGSAINFLIVAGRVRFEVAVDNAERRGLKLSSRLLTVAHFVRMAGQ
jgi:hypothetical protein